MPTIRVFEHTYLIVDNINFNIAQFNSLVIYNEKFGNKYFAVGYNRIYFTNYVGVIQTGNLIIEILPKADNLEVANDETKNKWHNALIHMLYIAGYLPIDSISFADLRLQNITLIELYYQIFIDEVKKISQEGLIKKFRKKTDNLQYLKGRLVFNKHISENYLHKELFYTEHQVYDNNNIYNRILKKALLVLKNTFKNNKLFTEICNLNILFENADDFKVTDKVFNSIKFNRSTQRYKKAITLAKMILQNYSPDIKSGQNNVTGILFDMNILFERVSYKLLKRSEKHFKDKDLHLTCQKSKRFWNYQFIRPDIIGEYKINYKKKYFIIDTKWKMPKNYLPSGDDLKQIFTYNIQFSANKGILLYPEIKKINTISNDFNETDVLNKEFQNHSCSTFFINLINEKGQINLDCGKYILESLLRS